MEDFEDLRAAARHAAVKQGAGPWADVIADEAMLRLVAYEDEVKHPKAFVRRVASRLAIDLARREPEEGWGDMPLSDPPRPGLGYPEPYHVPSPSLEARLQGQVDQVLAVLDVDEQRMFVAKAAGLSDAEIAERHSYAVKTVRTKLSSARAKMKRAFPDWREDFDI